jgi:hypothetical protein
MADSGPAMSDSSIERTPWVVFLRMQGESPLVGGGDFKCKFILATN